MSTGIVRLAYGWKWVESKFLDSCPFVIRVLAMSHMFATLPTRLLYSILSVVFFEVAVNSVCLSAKLLLVNQFFCACGFLFLNYFVFISRVFVIQIKLYK